MDTTTSKLLIPTNAIWGDKVGYSRAVRVGNIIEVAGTTAKSNLSSESVNFNEKEDMYLQTKTTLKIIEESVEKAGGTVKDIIRTRVYVTDISKWEDVARAHVEVFGTIKPVTSLIQVTGFIDPELLVEIEATAILS